MTHAHTLERLVSDPRTWLSDGGLETDLIFSDGLDLPHFASFHAFDSDAGRRKLAAYYDRYIDVARQAETGFVLDTATWRSGAYWPEIVGRSLDQIEAAAREAVRFARATRDRHGDVPIVVNGAIGPAGDGYAPETLYDAETARRVHAPQVSWMAEEGVDLVTAVTMTHPGEAIGIVRAAVEHGPLPNGQTIRDAIAETDAATGAAPLWYMINCAHPDHFSGELQGDWLSRIGGIRANASRMSHAELDEAEELDAGDPAEFGALYGKLFAALPNLRIAGGCCGTDARHIGCAAHHVVKAAEPA